MHSLRFPAFITTLFIFSCHLLAMDPPMPAPIKRNYPLNFQPMPFEGEADDDIENGVIPHPKGVNKNDSTFENIPVADLKTVLSNAPDLTPVFIEHITNDEFVPGIQRFMILHGKHGTGKTVLAKAIAQQVCAEHDWEYEYISSGEFMGQYRNHTGVKFRGYLDKITHLKKPTIVIMDQLNKIMEYPDSSADDTAFAASCFSHFLDEHTRNENLYLIGIMDRGVTKICDRVKSRMKANLITLEEPQIPEMKRIIFTSKCVNDHTQLDPELNNEWLENFLEKNPEITGRHYRGLALQLKKDMHDQTIIPAPHSTITKQHLEAGVQNYIGSKEHLHHIDPYENYTDRLEREHRERMAQLQQQLQIQLQAAQEAQESEKKNTASSENSCILQ